ncbi:MULTISPECIES: hypothetical protein [Haloferax]|uniref:PH domain-containing protein n=2 Tax=Haloferax TaxID=2251 RepID=A0A6G1Z754_9EURY|nr:MULTISPECIES: hypothetical protein [Haloferax]KAB1185071.1 hypothetical protein Hfx1149_16240 [Haloferax sp. CBA1149]MRW82248.1 hypothetical protein [Haloferax marinisediminis]
MGRRDSLDVDIFQPLWAAGWQWLWIVAGGLFLGGYFIFEFGDLLEGAGIILGSVALAALGIRYVDTNYEAVLDSGTEQAQSALLDLVGFDDDSVVSSTSTAGQTLFLVEPAREYHLTTLAVGDDSFVVHDDATVSLAHRYYTVGDDAHTYAYESIESVGFDAGTLRITSTDGSTASHELPDVPTSALSAVRERMSGIERDD